MLLSSDIQEMLNIHYKQQNNLLKKELVVKLLISEQLSL